jgi:uncharacterized protein YcbX
MPSVERIFIYPIKSMDGVSVNKATIGVAGSLAGDREFAFMDEKGKFINGKRYPKIIQLRARFDLGTRRVTIRMGGTTTYSLDDNRVELSDAIGNFLGIKVGLESNPGGFPDDTEAHGPTIVSRETLTEVARWFPGLSYAQMLLRFRPSIMIAECEPFWEDQLVGPKDSLVEFTLGDVTMTGAKACARCAVPSFDPIGAKEYPRFQTIFTARRKQFLPEWAEASRFDHFYRLAVNTDVAPSEIGKTLHIGDQVNLLAGSAQDDMVTAPA